MAGTNKILGQGEGFGTPAVPVSDIEALIVADNAWVKVVPNDKEATLTSLRWP